ncbi:MAG: hypothetical protein COW08_03665 [Ignavibacteriales bacterium CG12_big_fil_rev_8_21_14_0_65_30_8]|nr:MAG: hypothetical protein COW08_03665 [Ignavibacteriales bacterium CG12_big_fil_rev_8_21_14_0_65_30_8]
MSKKKASKLISVKEELTDFLLYTDPNGKVKVEVILFNETIWLTQQRIVDLFGVTKSTISEHLNNIFESGELEKQSTVRNFRTVRIEGELKEKSNVQNLHISGSDKPVKFYNLDVIISVGYRINSRRATLFLIWATQRLKEYIIKGFVVDDDRLKNGRYFGKDYFQELLEVSAIRNDGSVFSDHDVHRYLRKKRIKNPEGEWFKCSLDEVKAAILSIKLGMSVEDNRSLNFKMRPEKEEAVNKTIAYSKSFKKENPKKTPHFLWNAKMRFGKTFATYQLAKKMGWKKLLVLTFKPAVQSAWEVDLKSHIDFSGWQFISRNGLNFDDVDKDKPFVCFGSFQDYLGKNDVGGITEKGIGIGTSLKSVHQAYGLPTKTDMSKTDNKLWEIYCIDKKWFRVLYKDSLINRLTFGNYRPIPEITTCK